MEPRYGEYPDDRDEREARPTRFWGGAERSRDSEASGSTRDDNQERYGERYRDDRFRHETQPRSYREAGPGRGHDEQYGRGDFQARSQQERSSWRSPEWPVEGYESQRYASGQDDFRSEGYGSREGAWTGRQEYPYRSYAQDRAGESRTGGTRASGHRGKGPKGYERTDDRLKELICERLTDDDSIDASEVTVSVAQGRVTLDGTVDSRQSKYDIEECVEQCGAKEIINNLRIERNASRNLASDATGNARAGASGKEARSNVKGH